MQNARRESSLVFCFEATIPAPAPEQWTYTTGPYLLTVAIIFFSPFKHFHNSLPVSSCKPPNFGQYLLRLSYTHFGHSQEAVGFYHKNTSQVYLQRCYLLSPQTPFKFSLGLQSGNEETTGIMVKATCVNKTALQFTFAITCVPFFCLVPIAKRT